MTEQKKIQENKKSGAQRLSFAIRKLTVPPTFALALLVLICALRPQYMSSAWQLLPAIGCLCVLPLLAYPLQKYIPHFKDKGRDGQRTLAMLFSFSGYLIGTLLAFLTEAPVEWRKIFLEYLLCGILILISNKLLKIKASGHACGIVGPVLLLLYFGLYIPAAIGAMVVIPVFVSSVKTGRHTLPQLLGGSLIPLLALAAVHFVL